MLMAIQIFELILARLYVCACVRLYRYRDSVCGSSVCKTTSTHKMLYQDAFKYLSQYKNMISLIPIRENRHILVFCFFSLFFLSVS